MAEKQVLDVQVDLSKYDTAEEVDAKIDTEVASGSSETLNSAKNYADQQDAVYLQQAKDYTDLKASQLEFIKFVDELPATGDSKYIYAVLQDERTLDDQPIFLLFLWDGTEWANVGVESGAVDPSILQPYITACQAAQAAAEAAQNAAETAEDNANTAKDQALSAQVSAEYAKTAAETAKAQAETFASNASTSATTAQTQAGNAQTFAQNALSSATDAETYSDLSKQWAIKTDGTVDDTEYSSKYYAQQSAQSSSQAQSEANLAQERATNAASSASQASSYAQEAKNWANKTDSTVDGVEYSAKHYANLASGYSAIAQTSASSASTSAQNAADSAASIDPDNLANKGLENTGRLTNCITKIPQDIKFDLSSEGTLTLKAGSKVWYPNGKDEVGGNVFASLTLAEDISFGYGSILDNLFLMLSVDGSVNWMTSDVNNNITSGGTGPSQSNARRFWYDTANNKIYCYAPNSDTPLQGTFPLAILKCTAENVFEIKKVFNGFGYIGQTLFALPGVEGLSPNGRNADGSLKNELMTLDHVVTRDYTWYCAEGQYVFLGLSQEYGDDFSLISTTSLGMYKQQSTPPDLDNYITWHRLDENKLYRTEDLSVTPNWVPMHGFAVGPVFNTGEGTNVSSWNIACPVAAVDMSNTSYMSKMGMPSDKYISLIIGSSNTHYIAPANGYLFFGKKTTMANQYAQLSNLTAQFYIQLSAAHSAYDLFMYIPARAGDDLQISYTAGGSGSLRFIYAEGEK